MPELPEVETVARDLRPLIVGATITGIRNDWPRTIRGEDVEALVTRIMGTPAALAQRARDALKPQ